MGVNPDDPGFTPQTPSDLNSTPHVPLDIPRLWQTAEAAVVMTGFAGKKWLEDHRVWRQTWTPPVCRALIRRYMQLEPASERAIAAQVLSRNRTIATLVLAQDERDRQLAKERERVTSLTDTLAASRNALVDEIKTRDNRDATISDLRAQLRMKRETRRHALLFAQALFIRGRHASYCDPSIGIGGECACGLRPVMTIAHRLLGADVHREDCRWQNQRDFCSCGAFDGD